MKKDNKGFTLLELLVAVIILAIVVTPMLHSFVTSYRVNARSREIMRATTLAQNEMEIFEKEKLEVLLDNETYDYEWTPTTYTSGSGSDEKEHTAYTFTYNKGIINDETGREMYDVVVKLDPESALDTDLYHDQNTAELLYMNTLSGVDSGAYVQSIRSDDKGGEDEEAYEFFYKCQVPNAVTGNKRSMEEFAKNVKRTITLKIEKVEQHGVETTVVKVKYEYICTFDEVPDDYRKYPLGAGDKIIFNNSQTLDDKGKPVELKSVYLFYAPRYNTYYPNDSENIVIENKEKLPVNIYIIRQNIKDSAGNIWGKYIDDTGALQYNVPTGYVVNLKIHEGLEGIGADSKTYGSYFTNLNVGLDGTSENGSTNIELYDVDNYIGEGFPNYNTGEAIKKAQFRFLGSTESKDRIYTMEVAVYAHGADPTTEDPLVRLTGTKIE